MPALLDQLAHPEIYPGDVDDVEIHQTHLSIVCLAGDSAYKLKKPIQLPFVDFSTLEKRQHFCEEEVRLNRRLCPEVYRGVRPLFRTSDRTVTFHDVGRDEGEIIDYAVEMQRLPEDRMLNHLLEENTVNADAIRDIAHRMTEFHRRAERGEAINAAGAPNHLRRFAEANFEESRNAAGTIFDAGLHRDLQGRTRTDFDKLVPTLQRRLTEGHVVDGHGDLHARNICLTDPAAIYDCIEFNTDFRCGDTATDNAFLVMDLRYRGHPELATAYLDAYIEASGDDEQRALMSPLARYRAMVRAKVSAIAAGEAELSPDEHREALDSAHRHFHHVAASFIEDGGPWLIIACGLPGSGKSTVLRELAAQTGWRVFGSDKIRKELAGVAEADALPGSAYSHDFTTRTYTEVLARAAEEARQNRAAFADANFRTRNLRALARKIAGEAGLRLALLSFTTPEEVILDRLKARTPDDPGASDADLAVYRKLKSDFEPSVPDEADLLLEIDATPPPEEIVPVILRELLGQSRGQ